MKKEKVSLCCITGNSEKYINRFLDSFQPHVDEVVMVRAIGNQTADKTIEIAKKRGCIIGEYENTTHPEWPHVDNFGAARNVAFDMASHDWVMWADLDDVLEGGEHIKAELALMPADCLAMSVPYDVTDDQVRVMRERIIRKGATRWKSAVHECLDFPTSVKTAETNRFQTVHKPLGSRGANDERNVRILESLESPTGSERFHLIQSLRAVGRIEEALKLGADVLTNAPEDLGKPELYETAFTLAQLAQDDRHRSQLMWHALSIDPSRREAYGDLAMGCIARNEGESALGLVQAMNGLPMPATPPWNLRRKYYGHLAPLLHGAALRANNNQLEADAIERNHFMRNGAKISLLHATRGRPAQASQARWQWMDKAKNPDAVEHIFALDVDDPESHGLRIHKHVWCAGGGGPVEGWNHAAKASAGKVLVQMSDDFEPPLHWDEMILDELGCLDEEKILAVSDGNRKDDLLCMAIITRKRYDAQGGHMFHPEFFSMCSDNWFSDQAFASGCLVDARDSITFQHNHPAFGKAEMDETYARSNAKHHYVWGEGIYRRLKQGVKLSADMRGWFDFRQLYDLLALKLKDGQSHVEIGVWEGKSISYLYDRLEDLGKRVTLTGVDTFEGDPEAGVGNTLDAYRSNIGQREIREAQSLSVDAATTFEDSSLDSIFIDGAHDYKSVLDDVRSWLPKLKTGGVLAGHDIDSLEVQKALDEADIPWARLGRCWVMTEAKPNKDTQ